MNKGIPHPVQPWQANAAPATSAATAQQMNAAARSAVLGVSIDMMQQIASVVTTNYVAGQPSQLNIPIRNVGLIKRFFVEVVATVSQGGAETQTLTRFGPANVFSNITLTDLSNQARINTTGWHLHNLATVRRQLAFGAAFTNDSPCSIGSNYNVIKAPASVTAAAPLYMCYEIPVSYGDQDLRGAIYANVVNATMNLQLTINPNFFVVAGADPVLAVYQSSTAQLGKVTSITVNVYQNYLDQLPRDQNNNVVLPQIDLATVYLLNNTNVTGLGVGADQAIPYANFRNFLSTFLIYDNNGVLNAGSDINYMTLQTANYTNVFKYDPMLSALQTRTKINDDFPPGMYYFDHRMRPISTVQYGNMQLIVNPSQVNSAGGSMFLIGYESLAMTNMITQAGSLYQS